MPEVKSQFLQENGNSGVLLVRGKQIAQEIIEELKRKPKLNKFLAAVLVGNNPASVSFLKQKEKVAKELGVDFRLYKFPADIKQDPLRKEVLKIAQHRTCGGIIVQLPLPEHLNKHYVLNVIPREKDVDVLSERALGAFYTGRNPVLPPAVSTVQTVLQNSKFSRHLSIKSSEGGIPPKAGQFSISKAVVVGRGFLVGKPIATWLTDKVSELYVLGSKSDLGVLKQADLVISGVGKAGLIKPEMLKQGAGVIDFGYDTVNGKISGDFDVSQLANQPTSKLSFYTPTPGGTGPILVAELFSNFFILNQSNEKE